LLALPCIIRYRELHLSGQTTTAAYVTKPEEMGGGAEVS
jgi:hypothetical protein